MTEICFDGTADGWNDELQPAANSNPYAKVIGFGLAAALSTTAIFTLMHRDAFRHSSWGGVVAGAVDEVRSAEAAASRMASRREPAPAAPQTALRSVPAAPSDTAHRMARIAARETPSWLPDGMDAISVERSARLARRDASAVASTGPAGLRNSPVIRSTRLALAEPAAPQALVRDLEAARPPVPSAPPVALVPSAVETASLEPGAVTVPLPSAVPQPRPSVETTVGAAPVPPEKAPAAP